VTKIRPDMTNEPTAILWFEKEYAFLSNFFPSPIIVLSHGGKWPEARHTFKTVEHGYQAMKATRKGDFDAVRTAMTPAQAKWYGNRMPLRGDWEDVKNKIMMQCLRAKFLQNDALAQRLLDTGERRIFEGNTWNDTIWGVCYSEKTGCWTGENRLGLMLEEVRDEIRSKS